MKHASNALKYWTKVMLHSGEEYINVPTTSFFCTELVMVYTTIALRLGWFQLFDCFEEITELSEDPNDYGSELTMCFDVKKICADVLKVQEKLNDIMFAHYDMVHLNPLTDKEAHEALMAADPMYVSDLDAYYEVDDEFDFDPNEPLSLTPVPQNFSSYPMPISTHDVVV